MTSLFSTLAMGVTNRSVASTLKRTVAIPAVM